MAENTQETAVRITGDGVSAIAAMKQASEAVQKGVASIQGSLGNMTKEVDKVSGAFKAFASVVAGVTVAAISKMVSEFSDGVEATMDLSRSLGVTTNSIAGLQAALDDVGASTSEYESAAKGLQRELTSNEDRMKALGLVTRDQKGELRPLNDLMIDAIKITNDHKEGLDRNMASRDLFGRGISGSSRLLLLNEEAIRQNTQAAEELGLVVGQNATEAWQEFDAANDRASLTMKAFSRAVGETVMPAVTTMVEMFNSAAPAAIQILRVALSGLVTAFLALANGVRLVWEVINAMVFSVAEPILALGKALVRIMKGDFEGAAEAIRNAPKNIAGAWEQAWANVLESSTNTHDRIVRMWDSTMGGTGGTGTNQGSKGTRSAIARDKPGEKEKRERKEHLDSRMQEWEAELAEQKIKYQRENDLREMSKEQELAYWQALSEMADVNARERVELRKRTASTELEIMKAQRAEQMALSEEAIAAFKAQQMDFLEAIKQENQYKLDTQQITQAEMLVMDEQLENDRYRITREAVQARLELLAKDPTKNAVALQKLNDELAAVEREHSLRQRGIQMQQQKEQLKDWRTMFDNIGQSFGSVVQGLIAKQMTLGQALKSLLGSVLGAVGNFIGQIVAKKVAAFAMEKAMAMGLITVDAAKAGAGAAASQAGIPIVGPAMALSSMAMMMAAVMGLGATVASARGGYDIPSGVNPMTQLHEEEMVLPRDQANAIRDMASGGGMGGASVTIQALDARSFEHWLRGAGGDVLIKHLGGRKRDNAYKP